MLPRALLLANPRARRALRVQWRDAVLAVLRRRFETELIFPTSADETTQRARQASDAAYDVVIAGGGDGTINAVVRGLVDGPTSLGILPLGTANDLARELGIPHDPAQAACRVVDGTVRTIDVVQINGLPFVGVGGLALVAQSALAVSRIKERSLAARAIANAIGGAVYRVSATANLLGRWRISDAMRIAYRAPGESGERILELRIAALFVTNHRTAGGGIVLPVEAHPADGVFELGIVPERTRPSLALNFARLSAGRSLPSGVLVPIRAVHAIVETENVDAFVADGDLLATGRRFELSARPSALRVIS